MVDVYPPMPAESFGHVFFFDGLYFISMSIFACTMPCNCWLLYASILFPPFFLFLFEPHHLFTDLPELLPVGLGAHVPVGPLLLAVRVVLAAVVGDRLLQAAVERRLGSLNEFFFSTCIVVVAGS